MAQPSTSASVDHSSDDAVLRLDSVPVLVDWAGPDGQTLQLGDSFSASPVSLDMTFDSTAKYVLLRLRIVVQIHRDSSNKTPLYIYIGPEDIETVTCRDSHHNLPASSTSRLDIRLRRSVTLIGPPFRLRPSNKARANVINSARDLTMRREFCIRTQDGLISESQYTAIREAVYSEYRSSGHLDLASLYGGLGGKQIGPKAPETDPAPEDDGTEVPPPSYDEVEAPPPMAPLWQGKTNDPRSSCLSFIRV